MKYNDPDLFKFQKLMCIDNTCKREKEGEY